MTGPAERPLTLLIAALGGEGGGLLTDWVIEACREAGVLVQATSIPGVAQRTGATTYYVEMMKPLDPDAPEPLFGLYPAPGFVDVAVASELVEAGRMIEAGFVTPDRTTLIASTHRVYAIAERTAMADGSFQGPRITDAALALAARALLRDYSAAALSEKTALNALLLGAISTVEGCPVPPEAFEAAIRTRGVAVDANLKGFALGRAMATGEHETPAAEPEATAQPTPSRDARIAALPSGAQDVIHAGVERLTDYLDAAYADLYLDRLEPIAKLDTGENHKLTRETARYLALWMAYEDVIRVADLKSRASRFARVRRETGAKDHEPVRITEFLKPGIDEAATILPAGLGRRLTAWAERRGLADRLHIPLHVRTDTVIGYLAIRFMARLKSRRRKGLRYLREQDMIERWLTGIAQAAEKSDALALEWAECGRLIKGYSDTRRRADRNFERLLREILSPALSGDIEPAQAADWLKRAREAALADEDGKALEQVMNPQKTERPKRPQRAQAAE